MKIELINSNVETEKFGHYLSNVIIVTEIEIQINIHFRVQCSVHIRCGFHNRIYSLIRFRNYCWCGSQQINSMKLRKSNGTLPTYKGFTMLEFNLSLNL